MDKEDALYKKVSEEFEKYKVALCYKAPREIFDSSYRTSCYRELICMFENDQNWTEAELDAFLGEEDLLSTLYSEWLDCDSNVQDEFYYSTKNWLEQELQSETDDEWEPGDD